MNTKKYFLLHWKRMTLIPEKYQDGGQDDALQNLIAEITEVHNQGIFVTMRLLIIYKTYLYYSQPNCIFHTNFSLQMA